MNTEKIVVMNFGKRTPDFYDGIVEQYVWQKSAENKII